LRRLKQLHSRGWLYTLGSWINRIVPAKLFRSRVFRVYRLDPCEDVQSRAGSLPLEFRWADSREERDLAQQLTYFHSTAADQADRFRACLAWADDQVVGGVWRGTQSFDEEELGVRVMLEPNQAWIFAAFVSPEHRGARIYPRLLNHVLAESRSHAHYASINVTNRASLAAHRHFVVAQTGPCIVMRLLSVTFCWAGKGLKASESIVINSRQNPIEIRIK